MNQSIDDYDPLEKHEYEGRTNDDQNNQNANQNEERNETGNSQLFQNDENNCWTFDDKSGVNWNT